ncbi:MAG: T9SS type A sorting domain-containing protein [Bacteroidota bacterium]
MERFKQGINSWLLTIFMSCSLSIYAHDYHQADLYFNHLVEVNKEWLHHKNACPEGTISFRSDLDRIQLHLNLVIKYLVANVPSNLNSSQLANRRYLLGRLQEYADNKVFPINTYHPTRQPYFVDEVGTNCAVGQMIDLSGHEELVARISKVHNYDYIADIQTEGLTDWADEFGFNLEELKWIQPAYSPTKRFKQVLGGTNGRVDKLAYNFVEGGLLIAGEFTELNNLPCLNIGRYRNEQLDCLGSGVDGIIHDVLAIHSEGIYVFGELIYNGEVFPGAKYDGTTWAYFSVPDRDGAICTSANGAGGRYRLEMAISHPSIPGCQEIWHLLNDDTWEKQAKVNGVILDIMTSRYGQVHVGHLDTVVTYNSNAEIDTTLIVNNVLFKSNRTDTWFGTDDNVSDTVNVVADVGGALIFGGTCSPSDSNNICISRYFNSTLQPLFVNEFGTENYSIKTIAYSFGNQFVFGGEFFFRPGIGTFGSNLATYDLVDNLIEPIALFDSTVNSLAFLNRELFIGGSFQSNLRTDSVNFLAREMAPVGIDEFSPEAALQIYPNPFTTSIQVKGIANGAKYVISGIDGRTLKNGQVMDGKIDNLDFLSNGIYLLRLETEGGPVVRKMVK